MAFRDIRKSRRWLSVEEIRLLTLMLLVLGLLLAVNLYVARTLPGGEWLYMRWSGARAFLVEHIEPYSTEIAQRTQEVAYGRRAFASEYAYVLNDPFYIVLLYAPLAFLADFSLARGLWMLLSEIALGAIVLLSMSLAEWEPPRWLLVLVFGFGLIGYFSLNALLSGSPAIFISLLYLWILVAVRSGSDELAGVLLALVAYQWEVGGLFFLFILVYVFANHRWRVLSGFAMALFILMIVAFLVSSGWGLPYIRAVLSDWYRGANLTFGQMLATWFPDTDLPLGRIVAFALGALLLIEWAGSVHAHFRRVAWTAALSLAVTPLMGFAIFPANQVALLLAFILTMALVWERWQRRRVFFEILILLLLLGVPYALYARSVYIYDPLVTNLMAVLPSMAAIVGLYWMRWSVRRNPRTWFDRFGDYR